MCLNISLKSKASLNRCLLIHVSNAPYNRQAWPRRLPWLTNSQIHSTTCPIKTIKNKMQNYSSYKYHKRGLSPTEKEIRCWKLPEQCKKKCRRKRGIGKAEEVVVAVILEHSAFFDGFGCGITNAILVLQSLSHFRGKVQFSQPKKVFQRRSESRIT